jgi:hypothetical protein
MRLAAERGEVHLGIDPRRKATSVGVHAASEN